MANPASISHLESGSARIGILMNPLGGQARKRETAIRQILSDFPVTIMCEASDAPEFKVAINDLMQADIDLLVIIAGDGTIQAILSLLFACYPLAKWPVLLTIPGGTTNMTSLDLGIKGKPEQVLQRLKNNLSLSSSPLFAKRAVLCIEQTGVNKIYGMFFGIGLVARGVKFSRSSVKKIGITGSIFTVLIMFRSLLGMILGRNKQQWAPVNLSTSQTNGTMQHGTYLFGLISALDCLLLGIRPYWGKEQAPLHVTMVDQKRKHLWRSLWPLLSGRGHKLKPQHGYYSYNTKSLEFLMDDEYIIDGELYQATTANGPLRITATDPVTFLVV